MGDEKRDPSISDDELGRMKRHADAAAAGVWPGSDWRLNDMQRLVREVHRQRACIQELEANQMPYGLREVLAELTERADEHWTAVEEHALNGDAGSEARRDSAKCKMKVLLARVTTIACKLHASPTPEEPWVPESMVQALRALLDITGTFERDAKRAGTIQALKREGVFERFVDAARAVIAFRDGRASKGGTSVALDLGKRIVVAANAAVRVHDETFRRLAKLETFERLAKEDGKVINYSSMVLHARGRVAELISDSTSNDPTRAASGLAQLPRAIDDLNNAWDALTDCIVRQRETRDAEISSLLNQLAEARKE